MNKLQNIWNWLVVSSADPSKTALTVKGFLTTALSVILLISPLMHINFGQTEATAVVDTIVQFIASALTVIGAIVTLLAFIRKVMLTDWKNTPPTTPQV